MPTPLEKIAEYSKCMADIVSDISKHPENRAGLIKRLNDHFEVLEDAMFELNDEDLELPYDETPDAQGEVYLGGQSDE